MNELLNLYINNGVSLFSNGEKVVVLPLAVAINSLKFIKELNLLILGGDIYIKESLDKFEHTYDNWYYEGLSPRDSVNKAENYLKSVNNTDCYVSFIFK